MLSCTFDGHGCQHEALFLTEYKRTNRTKGTKILRCFPHCCPDHVNRSYCGSPIHVQVRCHHSKRPRTHQLEDADEDHHFINDLVVFARFEEVGQRSLSVNDELPASRVFSSIQTEQHPKGEWIQGHAHEPMDASTHLYQINRGARWYYEWESAATKAQRFIKHVLRVYVFQTQAPVRTHAGVTTLRVAAIASSSEFMVVSYRRAPGDLRADSRILALLAENVARQGADVDPGELLASLGHKVLPYLVDHGVKKEDHHGLASLTLSPSSTSTRTTAAKACQTRRRVEACEAQNVWVARHSETLGQSKRLAMLHFFLAIVPASRFSHTLSSWADSVLCVTQAEAWSDSRYSPVRTSENSWAFLPPCDGARRAPTMRFDASHSELSLVVEQCVRAASCVMFHEGNQRTLKQIIDDAARVLLNKTALREVFVRWISTLHVMIDSELRAAYGSSIQQLHEDIAAALFRAEEFKPVRGAVLELLSSTSVTGWTAFVAQTRLVFIRRVQRWHAKRCDAARVPLLRLSRFSQQFTGSWSFDSRQCLLQPVSPSRHSGVFSMGDAIEWMREFGSVDITTDEESVPSLLLRSRWALDASSSSSSSSSHGMRLILDGRSRVFDAFPSGTSSMVPWNRCDCGDYRGRVLAADHLQLEFTAWPTQADHTQQSDGKATLQYAVRLNLQLRVARGPHTNRDSLAVEGVVEQGECQPQSQLPRDEAAVTENRSTAVHTWKPVFQLQACYDKASTT